MDKLAIEAIGNIAAGKTGGAARLQDDAPGFADSLAGALKAVDADQNVAQRAAERFQLGDTAVTLEDTMITMQKANLSFQMLVQVRNRLLTAYHDIMNMQV